MTERDVKLPTTAGERKALPIGTGVLDYFPLALAAVAQCSHIGNEQHNPGKPLHWDRAKSTDEADALIRHFLERGTVDSDGVLHSAKMAWRALALLQKEIEAANAPTMEDYYQRLAHADAKDLAWLQGERLPAADAVPVAVDEPAATALGAEVVPVISAEGNAVGYMSGRFAGITHDDFRQCMRDVFDPRD